MANWCEQSHDIYGLNNFKFKLKRYQSIIYHDHDDGTVDYIDMSDIQCTHKLPVYKQVNCTCQNGLIYSEGGWVNYHKS